jgi:hypothetical protein
MSSKWRRWGAGDCVLLGNANVEETIGKLFLERDQTGWTGHRSSDRDDAIVSFGLFDDRFGECLGVARGDSLWWADGGVENRCIVEMLLVVFFGRRVPAALLRHHVDENRTVFAEFNRVEESMLHFFDVVAVERTDIANAQRLEERWRL